MDLKTLIIAAVDDTIEKKFSGTVGIVNYLKGHSKKNKLIGNLCEEINLATLQSGIKISKDTIETLVKDFTMMFANAALIQKEREVNITRDDKVVQLFKD